MPQDKSLHQEDAKSLHRLISDVVIFFDPILEKKGFTLVGSKNDIVSKNNILLFFVVYIQLMIFVALPATWKPI